MKTQKFLISSMIICGGFNLMNAQVPFQNTATALSNQAERVSVFNVSDNPNDRLEITNATQYNGQFIPQLWARRASDSR